MTKSLTKGKKKRKEEEEEGKKKKEEEEEEGAGKEKKLKKKKPDDALKAINFGRTKPHLFERQFERCRGLVVCACVINRMKRLGGSD